MRSIIIEKPRKDELTSKGFTNCIKINPSQTKESLMEYGFTNFNKPILYYMRMIDKDISFNLSVSRDSLGIMSIDILDENWCQPYDYQNQILDGSFTGKARNTYIKVNNILTKLQNDGIVVGYVNGMYI